MKIISLSFLKISVSSFFQKFQLKLPLVEVENICFYELNVLNLRKLNACEFKKDFNKIENYN